MSSRQSRKIAKDFLASLEADDDTNSDDDSLYEPDSDDKSTSSGI